MTYSKGHIANRVILGAVALGLTTLVPVSSGPLDASAEAQLIKLPKIKVPKIKLPTIVPRPEKVAGCGARGEKPCTANRAFPSCERGLEEVAFKYCRTPPGDIIKKGKNALRELGPLIKTIGGSAIRCGVSGVMLGANSRNPQATAQMLMELPCFSDMLDEARRNGYRTLTIGGSGGASIGIGAEGENGFAFDTSGNGRVATYHTLSLKFLSIGASTAVNVGLYKAAYNRIGGDAHGMSAQFTKLGGGGVAIWYGYKSDTVAGMTAVITSGAKGELAYVRNTTKVVDAFTARPQQVAAALRGPAISGFYRATTFPRPKSEQFQTKGARNEVLWYRTQRPDNSWNKWIRLNLTRTSQSGQHYYISPDKVHKAYVSGDPRTIKLEKLHMKRYWGSTLVQYQ